MPGLPEAPDTLLEFYVLAPPSQPLQHLILPEHTTPRLTALFEIVRLLFLVGNILLLLFQLSVTVGERLEVLYLILVVAALEVVEAGFEWRIGVFVERIGVHERVGRFASSRCGRFVVLCNLSATCLT